MVKYVCSSKRLMFNYNKLLCQTVAWQLRLFFFSFTLQESLMAALKICQKEILNSDSVNNNEDYISNIKVRVAKYCLIKHGKKT